MNRNNGYDSARAEYVLRLGDNCLILAQRLCAWCGHGPTLEEDLALSNVALDYLGQARLWLSYAGELEPARRDEDELAFLREAGEFRNVLLVEQPFGDFATVQARLFLFESWYSLVLAKLGLSRDARIAGIAGKAAKEVAYHLRRSSHWMVRLGDGTDISNGKLARALDAQWPYVGELFAMDALDQDMLDRGIGCDLVDINEVWQSYLKNVLADAKLTQPDQPFSLQYGKQGTHSEHMVWLLMEMQYLQRAYPGGAMVMGVQNDGARPDIARVWDWISHVPDPEMPFVSLVELGVVRDVRWDADTLRVAVTPTYSGCPAQRVIADAIRHVLLDHGVECIEVETRLAPPWTTDWIGPEGKAKLLAAGIAPPLPAGDDWAPLRFQPPSPACPYCGSKLTRMVGEFSGTLCKSLHVCDGCLNPFEHFKAI